MADQLAEAGYIAIAPDLLSGTGPGGGNTNDFETPDEATKAIYKLPPEQVTADLDAVADYALKLPAATASWRSPASAGAGPDLPFRHRPPGPQGRLRLLRQRAEPTRTLARIQAPVYGFYGGNDARINARSRHRDAMKELGKTFEPVIYEGAGHGFMRAARSPGAEADKQGREDAWERWKRLLAGL